MPDAAVSRDDLERLWEAAQRLEVLHDDDAASVAYTSLLRLYVDAGEQPKTYVQLRIVQNLMRLRRFSPAGHLLEELASRPGVARNGYTAFLVDLHRAELALLSANRFRAARILSRSRDGLGPLGRLAPERLHTLDQRIRDLSWETTTAQERAHARVEVRMLLSRLWASSGCFTPAVELLQRALDDPQWSEHPHGRRRMDLLLLAAEHHLDRGDPGTAERLISAHLEPSGDGPSLAGRDTFRWRMLSARAASLRGRFGAARDTVREALRSGEPPSLPDRHQARWWLAQSLLSLNRTQEVEDLLMEARKDLPPGDADRAWADRFESLHQLMERRRSAVAGEVVRPFAPEEAGALRYVDGTLLEDTGAVADTQVPSGAMRFRRTRERLAEDWARQANRMMLGLEDEATDVVDDALEFLERMASRTDSPRLRARTAFFRGVVAYHRACYPEAQELLGRALHEAHAHGCLHDAWQAEGFLAWASARQGDATGYAGHATRARALLDALIHTLEAEDRVFFRLNKWSAQDEYLAALARAIPRQPVPPGTGPLTRWLARHRGRHALLEVYRALSCLTGWNVERSLEDAPGPGGTRAPQDASTTLQVEEWVREHLRTSAPPGGAGRACGTARRAAWPAPRAPHPRRTAPPARRAAQRRTASGAAGRPPGRRRSGRRRAAGRGGRSRRRGGGPSRG